MILLKRTDASHPDFLSLVKQLDNELQERDGKDHSFYSQFNQPQGIKHAVLAYENEQLAGCGAMKYFQQGTMEIKRMFTLPYCRNRGIASRILDALEIWAAELGMHACLLETGKRQPEAIALYLKKGYLRIPNYGQYRGMENSVCFEKQIPPLTA